MPQSRKRQGHHPYKKTSNIPSSQRTSGHLTWAILFAIFAVLICFFAFSSNWIILLVGAIIGAAIGYVVGRNMEKSA
jgi:hypothetical protein